MKNFGHDVFELWHTAGAAVKDVCEVFLAQTIQRLLNFLFRKRGNRIAIILLIAGQCQRIECQRIILRRRDLFLDQRPEEANFDFG